MTKPKKLNDLQLILLSTASQREEGNVLPLPEAAAKDVSRTRKAIQTLLKGGLAAEADTNQRDRVWREEGGRRLTVVITDSGRAALGLSKSGEGDPPAAGSAEDEDAPAAGKPHLEARSGSKKALLLEMLRHEGGASLAELTEATGWLPHTARAAITGVRKVYQVMKQRVEGVTRYSISGASAQ
jgi:hypothetical protein